MRKMLLPLMLSLSLAATAADAPAGEADFKQGQALYDGGKQEEGLAKLLAAAEAGHVPAMAMLGWLYLNTAEGLPQRDAELGIRYYRQAAEAGSAEAANNLAIHYTHGIGVPKDPTLGLQWFLRAASLGHAPAMTSIGLFYETGTVVPADPVQAQDWYHKAAKAGDAQGMYNLGMFLARGVNGPADAERGRKWLQAAADKGEPAAKEALQRLDAGEPLVVPVAKPGAAGADAADSAAE